MVTRIKRQHLDDRLARVDTLDQVTPRPAQPAAAMKLPLWRRAGAAILGLVLWAGFESIARTIELVRKVRGYVPSTYR